MYRRVVLSNPTLTAGNINITVLYRVHGAIPLAQYRRYEGKYNPPVSVGQMYFPVVFDDAVKIGLGATLNDRMPYEIVLDVDENQPEIESVEELTSQGIIINVYNADGVIVCHNNVGISAGIDTSKTDGLGETAIESVDGSGETAIESVGGSGETAIESIDGSGEMI